MSRSIHSSASSASSASSSSSSSSSSGDKKPDDDAARAAIAKLAKSDPKLAKQLALSEPKLLAGMVIRQTKKTTLDKNDDNYDTDEDDFDENHRGSLTQPTPTTTVGALIENGKAEEVVLWRGTTEEKAKAMIANQSAGGAPADADAAVVDEATRKRQIGSGGAAPEFTSDPELAGFSRDNWLVVVLINTRYLVKGSGVESGWISRPEAPVKVLEAVDRTRNKKPKI